MTAANGKKKQDKTGWNRSLKLKILASSTAVRRWKVIAPPRAGNRRTLRNRTPAPATPTTGSSGRRVAYGILICLGRRDLVHVRDTDMQIWHAKSTCRFKVPPVLLADKRTTISVEFKLSVADQKYNLCCSLPWLSRASAAGKMSSPGALFRSWHYYSFSNSPPLAGLAHFSGADAILNGARSGRETFCAD